MSATPNALQAAIDWAAGEADYNARVAAYNAANRPGREYVQPLAAVAAPVNAPLVNLARESTMASGTTGVTDPNGIVRSIIDGVTTIVRADQDASVARARAKADAAAIAAGLQPRAPAVSYVGTSGFDLGALVPLGLGLTGIVLAARLLKKGR